MTFWSGWITLTPPIARKPKCHPERKLVARGLCGPCYYRATHAKRRASSKKFYDTHPEKARDHHLHYRYGLDESRFQEMLKAQNGVCAICGKPEAAVHKNGAVKRLAVDHDHLTDVVRGLLCWRCNKAIGLLFDNTTILENALTYLRKHQ
jgi:hypothetical protein